MFRKVCIIVFAMALGSCWASVAWAVDGGATDPSGDVMDSQTNEHGEGKLDIVSTKHSDDGVRVRYVLTTKGPFGPQDTFLIHWGLYDLAGMKEWDCSSVSVVVRVKAGAFVGNVERCNGSGGGGSGGPGGQEVLAAAQVVHEKDSNKIDVGYPISVLRDAGFTGTSIHYRVFTTDASQNSDALPDTGPTITHQLSPPPTPVPPTLAPTTAPTLVPTMEPSVVQTPGAAEGTGSSFSAPKESSDDSTGPITPLRVAAVGSVVGAAGVIALVRFWPF